MENNITINNRIPQLRFPGYTGDWEEKSFDVICHTITPPLKLQSSQYSSSGKFPIVDQSQTLICGWTNDSSGLLRNTPYIIFGDHTCVLKYIDFPFIQGADGVKILGSNKKDNSKFIYQLLLSNPVKQDGYKRHFSDLKEKIFLLPPSLEEQTKIAECLSSIDEIISVEESKVESLKAHKKGLMQQLFPQPGATTPALRFSGFTGDWQEKSFDVICHTITPPLKLQSSQYSSSGKFPIVDQSQTLICGWTNDSSGLLRNTPYIIFGDHTCVLKYIDFPFIQGADGVKILGSNKKDNSKFIYQLLLSNPVKQDGYKRHFSDLKEKIFLLPPSLEEQTKIAECLSSIDEIISVEESKVASLKSHKKGLMQQLFPQPVK